jgi:hypothetical protein
VDHAWTCACCGKTFNALPMAYAVPAPLNWFGLSEAERARMKQIAAQAGHP